MPLETDKSGGFALTLSEELRTGIFPDQYPNRVPLWEDGQDVRFTDVGVAKGGAYEEIIDTGNGSPIRGILQTEENSVAIAYFGDLTKLYRGDLVGRTATEVGAGYNLLDDAGASVWDGGSTTWDGGSTLWDFGLNDSEHWSIINYGSFILATSGTDDGPLIKKTTGVFTPMHQGVVGVTITNGGSGFVEGDTITFTDGGGSGAEYEVEEVLAGAITKLKANDGGSGYTSAPSTFTTSGSGTGATLEGQVTDIDVTTVKVWLNRGPHILGFNTSNSGREFIWCDADDVDTWVTASDNLAGALEIRELKSDIIAAVPLGQRIAVYGDDQVFLVNYLANDLVFGYQPALNGVGSVSPRSVVAVGNFNYGLSTQGFFRTDGATVDYIDAGKVRHWFQNNFNKQQISKCVAFHDEEAQEIRWSFPTDTLSAESAIAYSYQFDNWTFYSEGRTAAEERTRAPFPVTGTGDGRILYEGSGTNAGQAAVNSWLRSKPMDLGDPDRVKELSSLRVGYRGSGLQYRIGWAETENGTITWGSYTDVNEGYDFHNLRTAGRYLFIEIYSAVVGIDWELMSLEVQGRIEGTR